MTKISKKIIKLLDESKIKYEIIEHRTTYTAHDTAATNAKNKIRPGEVVKTLVLKADKEYFLAMIPSDKMLDKNKLKKVVNNSIKKEKKTIEVQAKKTQDAKEKKELAKLLKGKKVFKKIDFAKESWMKKHLMGKIGAVPPFSVLTKVQFFVDGLLLRQKQLYLGSGEYEFSIKMTPAQYQKIEKDLTKGSFGVTKKKVKKVKKKRK